MIVKSILFLEQRDLICCIMNLIINKVIPIPLPFLNVLELNLNFVKKYSKESFLLIVKEISKICLKAFC